MTYEMSDAKGNIAHRNSAYFTQPMCEVISAGRVSIRPYQTFASLSDTDMPTCLFPISYPLPVAWEHGLRENSDETNARCAYLKRWNGESRVVNKTLVDLY